VPAQQDHTLNRNPARVRPLPRTRGEAARLQAAANCATILTVARISRRNFVRVALAWGVRRVARWELSRWEVGARRSNPLLQFFHIQHDLVFHLVSPPSPKNRQKSGGGHHRRNLSLNYRQMMCPFVFEPSLVQTLSEGDWKHYGFCVTRRHYGNSTDYFGFGFLQLSLGEMMTLLEHRIDQTADEAPKEAACVGEERKREGRGAGHADGRLGEHENK